LQVLLASIGFKTDLVPMGAGRANLVAVRAGAGARLPLAFTGHVDVVPLGANAWIHDPFDAAVVGGRLYGRGSSDMKSGIAAFLAAAADVGHAIERGPGLVLFITAGEETGCEGARTLAAAGKLGRAGALVVGEPSANRPYLGHKGAFWLSGVATGVAAHGSMPEMGDNAVYKAARAVDRLSRFAFDIPPHRMLGKATLNVGSMHGGANINTVPDRCVISIDVRTIPGIDPVALLKRIRRHVFEEIEMEVLANLPPVITSPDLPWVRQVVQIAGEVTGDLCVAEAAAYFTDASILAPALGGAPNPGAGSGRANPSAPNG
jgi:succinyl-diaminopimelate desuccinylase